MARTLRVEFEGAIYHVTARGNERRAIFRTDGDRKRFLGKLEETSQEYRLRVYAYVLMENHYHLLVETPRGNLSAAMQQFQTSYVTYYNRKYSRSGHLFGGRYKAPLVEGDEYLLKLTRYIHLNPVKIRAVDGLPLKERVEVLRKYRWSSYPAYAELSRRQGWVDYGPLGELVSKGRKRQAQRYREYVESGMADTDEDLKEAMAHSSKAIGGMPFCVWVEKQYRELIGKQGRASDVAMRRREVAVEPDEMIRVVGERLGVKREELIGVRKNHMGRDLIIKGLKEFGGLSQREIGQMLGQSDGATISKRLKALRGGRGDPSWAKHWRYLEVWHDSIANYKA